MRIIGGKHKGRRINPPRGLKARPTTDFAREGLFNILQHNINTEDSDVLDLFAGTGAISLEFISRGARTITSVDRVGKHCRFISEMGKELNATNLTVLKMDVRRFIETSTRSFDIVFADPPYNLDWLNEIPNLVLSNNLVTQNGLLIVEHGKETDMSSIDGYMETRAFGNVNFSFFKP